MNNETSPTCPICSSNMEEDRSSKIAEYHNCSVCGYATDIDIMQAIREELIIKGDFDNE